jgi:hypothetical protein
MTRALLLGTALFAVAASGTAAPPTLTFTDDAVVIEGIGEGGRVAAFAVVRDITNFHLTFGRLDALLTDDDKDGVVEWKLERPVPLQSMWAAVDVESGEFAVATPGDYPLRRLAVPANALGASRREGVDALIAEWRALVEILLVRPGEGAWVLTAGADVEGDEDDDRDNGRIATALEDLQPLGTSPPPPKRIAPKDVLVVMDPDTMELYAGQLTGRPQ